MIRLRDDCLLFQTSDGELIPCSAEIVAIEMVASGSALDPQLVHQAASAVLHYFKHDLKRQQVTVHEFSLALEKILRGFGFSVIMEGESPASAERRPTDLEAIFTENGGAFELGFFGGVRAELRRIVADQPEVVSFSGLRACVKRILGRKRWSRGCENLSDQIVDYLRLCLSHETGQANCGLIVR